jgi:membrane protease YdiL (CAAX protease family)
VLTTPVQSAGEEYFFRGWLPTAIGSWFARPGWSLLAGGLVSTGLFGLAHGDQNVWLFADRFGFGLIATVLVWRTGGLEAGIAMHAVNNVIAFGFGIGYGELEESLEVSTAGALEVGIDLAVLALSALVLILLARRRKLTARVAPGWPPSARARRAALQAQERAVTG